MVMVVNCYIKGINGHEVEGRSISGLVTPKL